MFNNKKVKNYVISSSMEGVLLRGGKPLSHAKINRRLRWNGNDEGLVEQFLTDEHGRFSLPTYEIELSLGMLNQFVCSTKLEVEIEEDIYDVWYNNKFEGDLHAETDGPISDLVCDLSADEMVVEAGLSKIMTICRWANMPDSVFN